MLALKVYRLLYVLLAFSALWFRQDTSQGFFTTLFIFTAALLYDYWSLCLYGYDNNDTYHKLVGGCGVLFSIFYLLVSIMGLMNILESSYNNNVFLIRNGAKFTFEFSFNAYVFLGSLWGIPLLAGLEIFGCHKRATPTGDMNNSKKRTRGAAR